MSVARSLPLAALLLATSACDEPVASKPAAVEVTAEAIDHYCRMLLAEHEGPKGQAHIKSRAEPYWFSSARDALLFMRQPEEPRDITAVYVTDMAKAASWAHPEPGSWVEVPEAWFVIDSDRRGGMGGPEAVPFSQERAARAFVSEHRGRVVRFAEVPDVYLFGEAAPPHETGSHAAH